MSDNEFWSLADEFEFDNGEMCLVRMSDARLLSKHILEANNGDVEESEADFRLFNFSNYERALKIFNQASRKYRNKK